MCEKSARDQSPLRVEFRRDGIASTGRDRPMPIDGEMKRQPAPRGVSPAGALTLAALAVVACCALPIILTSTAIGGVVGAIAHAVGADTGAAVVGAVVVGGIVYGVLRFRTHRTERESCREPRPRVTRGD